MFLQIAIGLFAVYMLVRHVPAVLRGLRAGEDRRAARLAVPTVNVLLALVLLILALKDLARVVISRS